MNFNKDYRRSVCRLGHILSVRIVGILPCTRPVTTETARVHPSGLSLEA